jgi:hypothetical protein
MSEESKEALEQEKFGELSSGAAPKEERPTKEAWEAFREKIRALGEEVSSKARSLYGGTGIRLLQNKIVDFDRQLPRKEIDPFRYIAWHKLVGGGSGYDASPFFDMPKPHSVEDFLLKLKDDLDDKEKCQGYIDKGFRE